MSARTKKKIVNAMVDVAVGVVAVLHTILLALGFMFAIGMIMTMVGWEGDRNTLFRVMIASTSGAGFITMVAIEACRNRNRRHRCSKRLRDRNGRA